MKEKPFLVVFLGSPFIGSSFFRDFGTSVPVALISECFDVIASETPMLITDCSV